MRKCTVCGAENSGNFCVMCGGKVEEVVAPMPEPVPAPTPAPTPAPQPQQAYAPQQPVKKAPNLSFTTKILDYVDIIVTIILVTAGLTVLGGLIWGFACMEWDPLLGIGIFLGGILAAAFVVAIAMALKLLHNNNLQNKELIELMKKTEGEK